MTAASNSGSLFLSLFMLNLDLAVKVPSAHLIIYVTTGLNFTFASYKHEAASECYVTRVQRGQEVWASLFILSP